MPTRSRYFTPAEADALVPHVAARLRAIGESVARARSLAEIGTSTDGDAEAMPGELDAIRIEIERKITDLQGSGVDIKGLEPALVDFPALLNGQEVCLCWREGEDRIAWWHPAHTGFAGRQPLSALRAGAFEWEN